jgi:hypothetical protein
MDNEKEEIEEKAKCGGWMAPISKKKWAEVEHSYFNLGIWKPGELAKKHGMRKGTIENKIARNGWRKRLEEKMRAEEYRTYLTGKNGEITGNVSEQKDVVIRRLIDSVTRLLEKVQTRIQNLKVNEGSDMLDLVGALRQLQGMLDTLMGGLKGAGFDEEKKIDVRILCAAVKSADDLKGELVRP